MSQPKNILVFGATGISGVIFAKTVLKETSQTRLTLYVRNASKLPEEIRNNSRVAVVESALNDDAALDKAMKGIDAVISFLGAYVSFQHFLIRTKPTPIADSFPVIIEAMKKNGVKRIIALSTPSYCPKDLGDVWNWGWFFYYYIPIVVVPQGNAEMVGIANAVAHSGLDWTVFRVPHLNEGDENLPVAASPLGPDYKGTKELSRGSLAKWVLGEIDEPKWIGKAPVVGNPSN